MNFSFNIKNEVKFLNLLGYKIGKSNNSNKLIIFDEKDLEIGFIEYIKTNGSITNYHIKVDSSTIYYDATRKIKDCNDINFLYDFYVKRGKKLADHVFLKMNKYPLLSIRSRKYGLIDFTVLDQKMLLIYTSKTESFNIEESIEVELGNYDKNAPDFNKLYKYVLFFCDKKQKIYNRNNKYNNISNGTTLEIECDYRPYDCFENDKKMKITEKLWKNKQIVSKEVFLVDGTLEEVINKHKMGIESFSHFRYLVNKIIPFKEDIITNMLNTRGLEELEYSLFVPELAVEQKKLSKKL